MSLSERLNRGAREYVGQHPQVKDPTGLEGFKGQLAAEQWDERFQVGLRVAQLLQFGDSLVETIKNVFDPHERKQLLATMAVAATQIAGAAPAFAEGNTPPAIIEPVNTPSGRMPSSEAADQLVFALPRSEAAFAGSTNKEGNVTEPQPLLSIQSLEAIINEEGITGEWVPLTGEALPKAIQDYIRQQLDLGVDPRVFAEFADIKVQQDGVQKIAVKNITPDMPIPLLPYKSKLVEQVGVFNPEQNQIDVGVRTMFTEEQEFAVLAKDNEGKDIAFAVLPSVARLSERLTPIITSVGDISYIDDQGKQVVSRGPIRDVLNNKSSQPRFDMLTQVIVIKEDLVSEGGGGEASTALPENQHTLLKKISSVAIDGNAQLFTIPWVDATYYVPLPSGLIKPSGVFQMILDEATKTYKLTTDKGEQLAQFDPTHGMLWFNGESDGGKIRSQPVVHPSTETGQTTRQKETILIAGRWKPDGDQNYWYRLSLGWQRADLAHPSEAINPDLLPSIQPDDPNVVESPVTPESFDSKFSIPVPSATLQRNAGITDVSKVIYEFDGDMSGAPKGMVRAYLNGVHALSAEYNPANNSWEWKEPAMEGVPNPEARLLQSAVKEYATAYNLSEDEVAALIHFESRTAQDGRMIIFGLAADGSPLLMAYQQPELGQYTWESSGLKKMADAVQPDLQIGNQYSGWLIGNRDYMSMVANDFGLVTISYGITWTQIEDSQNAPLFFKNSKKQYESLSRNSIYDIGVRGHALIYPDEAPEWVKKGEWTAVTLEAQIRKHIQEVMKQYPSFSEWVVVNEPKGAGMRWNRPDVFADVLGYEEYVYNGETYQIPRYIGIAFDEASKANPDAVLIFNDTENHTAKGTTTLNSHLVTSYLKDKGYNVQLGMQMHIDAANPPDYEDLVATMRSYGVPVTITELDVDLTKIEGSQQARYAKQAELYALVTRAAIDSGVCKSITTWDLGDQYSWLVKSKNLPNSAATLADDNLNWKPAYYAMMREFFRKLAPPAAVA